MWCSLLCFIKPRNARMSATQTHEFASGVRIVPGGRMGRMGRMGSISQTETLSKRKQNMAFAYTRLFDIRFRIAFLAFWNTFPRRNKNKSLYRKPFHNTLAFSRLKAISRRLSFIVKCRIAISGLQNPGFQPAFAHFSAGKLSRHGIGNLKRSRAL